MNNRVSEYYLGDDESYAEINPPSLILDDKLFGFLQRLELDRKCLID